MIRQAKLAALAAADLLGVNSIFLRSRWRQDRLLILCYHGTALDDEDQWDPALYISPALLRERLRTIRNSGCTVLPLGEGLARLESGTLPRASVAITYDDGPYDFYKAAWPVLRQFHFPATVYLTTYYSEYNRPVFDPMCSYLLWKGRGRTLELPELDLGPVLLHDEGRERANRHIRRQVAARQLNAREKDQVLSQIASALDLDYASLCARRILHLMNPAEAAEVASEGVDLQLHTHRHCVSRRRERFVQEIEDNSRCLQRISSAPARHFCYPGGFYLPEFPEWLQELGIESATTCEPGIVDRHANMRLLPRLVDGSAFTACEFRAWLSGIGALLPTRDHPGDEAQLIENRASAQPVAMQ